MVANHESWQKQVKDHRMRLATSFMGVPDLREGRLQDLKSGDSASFLRSAYALFFRSVGGE